MAAHAKYATPHAQLRDLAAAARARGLDFEEFWSAALNEGGPAVTVGTPDPPEGAVRWPRDTADRRIARDATAAAKEGWRRAYEGAPPTRPEKALRILAPVLAAMEARSVAEGPGVIDGLPDPEGLSSAA